MPPKPTTKTSIKTPAQTSVQALAPFAHRNLPRLLLEAREAVLMHFRPHLRKHGLTDQQWRVLRVMAEQGACDAATIAQGAYLLGPSLTGVLARMERDGLLKRERDAQDARRQVIRSTAQGRRLANKLAASIEAHYTSMEQALGKRQLTQLYALLDAVIELPTPTLRDKARR
jgi:homoprotocatechuate degradation regulator HpaR